MLRAQPTDSRDWPCVLNMATFRSGASRPSGYFGPLPSWKGSALFSLENVYSEYGFAFSAWSASAKIIIYGFTECLSLSHRPLVLTKELILQQIKHDDDLVVTVEFTGTAVFSIMPKQLT